MFKSLMNRKTTKADVIMAIAAALVGVWKASDTIKDYKSQNEENQS
jgi:hypothetical protein